MSAPPPASVHLGTPPNGYQEWTSTKVHVHGFADLSAMRGTPVSPEFMALGNPWRLRLYPGGRNHVKQATSQSISKTCQLRKLQCNLGIASEIAKTNKLCTGKYQSISLLVHFTVEDLRILRSAQHSLMPLSMELWS